MCDAGAVVFIYSKNIYSVEMAVSLHWTQLHICFISGAFQDKYGNSGNGVLGFLALVIELASLVYFLNFPPVTYSITKKETGSDGGNKKNLDSKQFRKTKIQDSIESDLVRYSM